MYHKAIEIKTMDLPSACNETQVEEVA